MKTEKKNKHPGGFEKYRYPLPPGLIDAMKGLVDSSTADISGTVPFLVKQVAFRNGCFWVSGVTPG